MFGSRHEPRYALLDEEHGVVGGAKAFAHRHASTISALGLVGTTAAMLVDQGLDAAVMVHIADDQHWPIIASVMGLSIIGPQIVAWAFLKLNDKSSWAGLLRTLLCPLASAAVLAFLWASGRRGPTLAGRLAVACIPISVESLVLLVQGLGAGRMVEGGFWGSVAEGLLEAPASAALTLYSAMLTSVSTGQRAGMLFMASFAFSVLMIAKTSMTLHFHGTAGKTSRGWQEYAHTFCLQKLPQVISQILGIVFFAFMTRPLSRKEGFDDDLQRTSRAWPVFIVLALHVALNLGMLHTISPKMAVSVAAFLATTMTTSSPPGFLPALDAARLQHAVQQLFSQILMAGWVVCDATPQHWAVLSENYLPLAVLYVLTTPWAFVASLCMRRAEEPEARAAGAAARFDSALLERDRIMARLLLDVEQVVIKDGVIKGLDFIDTGRGATGSKWNSVVDCGGLAVFGPFSGAEVMILDVDSRDLAFVDTGRGPAAGKWHSVADCGGLAVFCPCDSTEVMILDPASRDLAFVDTKRGPAAWKWAGVADCGGLAVFCPFNSEEVMILDPASQDLAFVDTKRGPATRKWVGVAGCGGLAVFCPSTSAEVMILDPVSRDLAFVDTGRGPAAAKWDGVADCGGFAVFCPCDSAEIMILDPASRDLAFVDTGRGPAASKWHGVADCGGLAVFCPYNSAEVMILDPASRDLAFVDTGRGPAAAKWAGVADCGGLAVFCPYNSAEIMILDPASYIQRKDRCRELRLLE